MRRNIALHNLEYYITWPLFARDQHVDSKDLHGVFPNNQNLYGVYPFYMGIESDYNAHGVLILNSNAQEITFGPAPQIVYRTIGGLLDIYFFPGPTPEDVLKQYLAFVGYPMLPPYWGLGFQHNLEYYITWPLFARDQHVDSKDLHGVFPNNQNLYGVYPFYMGIESDYNAHGVLILNSNAQEITFGPAPQIIYRTIGGLLDIYFFPGPTPEDVLKQYLAFVGYPMLPPYWGLGFQVIRQF
uniref:Alpha-glucosidase n=1 Tax=Ascaris lumbricoides TaxID=6252 RepID=A0A0M3IW04_ASCLU